MDSGRELFRRFLQGEPLSRPAYVPLLRGLAARVGGVPREVLASDPTIWANSLVKTARLFDLDGVVAGFHFSLMAQACGCRIDWRDDRPVLAGPPDQPCQSPEDSPAMRAALEAARRVFEVCRHERACVAALTGPVTLAHQLFGAEEGPRRLAEAKKLLGRVSEAFCTVKPDVLIFLEGAPLAAAILPQHIRAYHTLKNIASHYDVICGLYLQGYQPAGLPGLADLRLDLYTLGPSCTGGPPSLPELWQLGGQALGVGLSLPLGDAEGIERIIAEGLQAYRARGVCNFFFTSLGPLTREVDLEALHQIVERIRQVRL